jgi:hypothetical protein
MVGVIPPTKHLLDCVTAELARQVTDAQPVSESLEKVPILAVAQWLGHHSDRFRR